MKHSVEMEYSRCRGCTTCIKGCPTEAIRVRSGKASILNARCIDCGTCIRLCPHKAIKSVSDPLEELSRFKHCVALPEPALYGQFQNVDDIDLILNGLLELGFVEGARVELLHEGAAVVVPGHGGMTAMLGEPRGGWQLAGGVVGAQVVALGAAKVCGLHLAGGEGELEHDYVVVRS